MRRIRNKPGPARSPYKVGQRVWMRIGSSIFSLYVTRYVRASKSVLIHYAGRPEIEGTVARRPRIPGAVLSIAPLEEVRPYTAAGHRELVDRARAELLKQAAALEQAAADIRKEASKKFGEPK